MESLFNERLQVRTRHLEERIGALSKQLAAQKEDNARLHRSHADATRKVQLLEDELRSERGRCHKLAVKLSSSRRHAQKKSPRYEENDHPDSIEPVHPPSCKWSESQAMCFVCGQCSAVIQALHLRQGESCKTDQSHELLPNYLGIMPARLNVKLMKSKKTSKSNWSKGLIAHRDRQASNVQCPSNLDNHCRCVNGCGNVELLLARKLCLYDPKQQVHCNNVLRKQDHFKEPLAQNASSVNEYQQSGRSKPPAIEQCGKLPMCNMLRLSNNSPNAKPVEQDLCALHTLSTEGFYVRMESLPSSDQQQCHGLDNGGADYGIDSINRHNHHELQSLQYVRALQAENEALKGALLSAKKVEIEELESKLREMKQSASSASTVVTNQSCESRQTKIGNCMTTSNGKIDENVKNEYSRFDPIKFLDCPTPSGGQDSANKDRYFGSQV